MVQYANTEYFQIFYQIVSKIFGDLEDPLFSLINKPDIKVLI